MADRVRRSARRLPPLHAVRAFEAAARYCNFAQAGKELNVSASAVSQQVKVLEAWFGFALFQRGKNSLELTREGEALLPPLKVAFDSIAEVSGQLRGDQRAGRVRIAAYPNLALKWLVPRLALLHERVPGIEIEITTAIKPLPELFTQCDLAIRTYEHAPQFSFDRLLTAELFPVAAPGLVSERDPSPQALLRYPLLQLEHAPGDWRSWFEAVGHHLDEVARTLWFDSQAVMIEAARHGHGIALARSPFDDRDVADGVLHRLSPISVVCDESWYVIAPEALRRGKAWDVKHALLDEARRDQRSANRPPSRASRASSGLGSQ